MSITTVRLIQTTYKEICDFMTKIEISLLVGLYGKIVKAPSILDKLPIILIHACLFNGCKM